MKALSTLEARNARIAGAEERGAAALSHLREQLTGIVAPGGHDA